jgi:hypothetical protein
MEDVDLLSYRPIRFHPVSETNWIPNSTSYPVPTWLTIHGDSWIPEIINPSPTPPPVEHAETFSQFLKTLEPWEWNLFPELSMEIDCYEFVKLVNAQDLNDKEVQLIMVSNGSEDIGSMRFGWVIALPNGSRWVRCSGPAFGPQGPRFGSNSMVFFQ